MNDGFNNEPIILDNNTDLVGNIIYSDYLYEVIEKSLKDNQVETIALYGDWGIGKSSVIDTVQNKYLHRNVKFITYSAWKYSSDDFRKSFIINLDEDYEDDVYSTTTKTNYSMDIKKQYLIITLIIVFLILVIICTISFCKGNSVYDYIFKVLSTALMTAVVSYTIKTILIETSISKKKIFTPKEFSDTFKKIMKYKLMLNNYVFIIDDLDRCSYNDVLEILSCIHGFMKVKAKNIYNYLFLIPIDKNRLKYALEKERKYSNTEQEKYLDKMFDISINIDKAGINNLYNMTKNKCINYAIPIKPKSIDMLVNFYIETPRDVNKSLEKIQSELSIQKKKYQKGYTTKEISEDEIIKFFILKSKWPELYDKLLTISNVLKLDQLLLEMANDNPKYLEIENYSKFKQFVFSSQDISIVNINYYHYLKSNDIYYDPELSSIYLSGSVFAIDNKYKEEQLINTFLKTFSNKRKNSELILPYIEGLMKSYMWLIFKLDSKQELFDNVSPSDICIIYASYIKSLIESQTMLLHVNKLTDSFGVLLSNKSTHAIDFINIFIKELIDLKLPFEILYLSLINEKNNSILTNENIKNILLVVVHDCKLDDNSFSFIFENLNKYRFILCTELWIVLLRRKLYLYLIPLSIFDDLKYGSGTNNILDALIVFGQNNFMSFNTLNQNEKIILNKEFIIMANLMKKPNQFVHSFVMEKVNSKTIDNCISYYYSNYSISKELTEGLAKFIVEYDEVYDKENQIHVYKAIHTYLSYRNSQFIQFLVNILDNMDDIDAKYDSFIVASAVTDFDKNISELFIKWCNKKENPNYIKFIDLMEKTTNYYDFHHKYYNKAVTKIPKQYYIKNLQSLFNNLDLDVFQEIVPSLSISTIFKNVNYVNNMPNLSADEMKLIFEKVSTLVDLLKLKNIPSLSKKQVFINKTLKRIFSDQRNVDLYRNSDLLNKFVNKSERDIIDGVYP